MTNITLFSQIIGKLDRRKFSKLVAARQTDKHEKGCNSWTHLTSMLPMPICQEPVGSRYKQLAAYRLGEFESARHRAGTVEIDDQLSKQKPRLAAVSGLLFSTARKVMAYLNGIFQISQHLIV